MGRWLPKPTPYRLLVIWTTIGLGTAKAYATAKGFSFVATSIEWIAGVVVFSVIFILGLFEAEPPRLLSWFMASDLLEDFFYFLPLTPPEYRSDEATDHRLHHLGLLPPINGYQIVTGLCVSSFGIVKAYLAYRELPQSANAVDWILGVIIASCLYILGLYEKNPTNYMPYLFSTDYSSIVYHILLVTINLVGIVVFSLACALWYQCRGMTGQDHWPSMYPPSLLNGMLIVLWLTDRCCYYAWLLALAGVVLVLFALLLRPLWHYPSFRRVRETIHRTALRAPPAVKQHFEKSPWWIKESSRTFLIFLHNLRRLSIYILGCSAGLLVSGYLTLGSLSGFRSQWLETPESLVEPLPLPLFYIFKCIMLLCIVPCILCMFALFVACFVYLILALASLFHTGWRRRWFRV